MELAQKLRNKIELLYSDMDGLNQELSTLTEEQVFEKQVIHIRRLTLFSQIETLKEMLKGEDEFVLVVESWYSDGLSSTAKIIVNGERVDLKGSRDAMQSTIQLLRKHCTKEIAV